MTYSTAAAQSPGGTRGIDFLIHSRATAAAADVDDERAEALTEEHWRYMDRYADGMTARGPVLAADRETWRGSVHIVALPSNDAVREFVAEEPYQRAGLFEEHRIWRFNNLLGKTMWDFQDDSEDPPFFVIAQSSDAPGEHARSSAVPGITGLPPERLIVHGELLEPEVPAPVGVAFAVHAPNREAVHDLLPDGRALLAEHVDIQVLEWEFGGRR